MKKHHLKNIIRDWKIIVSTFAVCLVLLSGLAWKVYLSNQIGGGLFPKAEVPADSSEVTMDSKRLTRDILIMETKQADFTKAKTNNLRLVDPSL
jgi:hypothetical protein